LNEKENDMSIPFIIGPDNVEPSKKFGFAVKSHDGRTVDSTGAFMVGELERLDQTLHMPLASVTWHRDIDLREDVTIADELSSFTLSTAGTAGGLGTGNSVGNGKSWAGKDTNQITSNSLDISKTTYPLRVWAQEVKYTVLELESAAKLGRPVDQQKFEFLQLKHQMDIDEQVYYGDTATGDKGLLNSTLITNTAAVANGASGHTPWVSKTPAEILLDVNALITSVWAASAWAVMPNRILLPPAVFGYISTTTVSTAGNVSILKYLEENNITVRANRGGGLQFFPCKWLIGLASGGVLGTPGTATTSYDVMFCYTKDKQRVRYPMTMLQRTPIQYSGLWHMTTYFCRLGVVEVVYPETAGWRSGV
jgi:hypothetical protein